jgi:hypothetical protein
MPMSSHSSCAGTVVGLRHRAQSVFSFLDHFGLLHPHDCPLILRLFPLIRTSSSHSRQPLPRAVVPETAQKSGRVCLFAPGESGVVPNTDRSNGCPRESSRSLERSLIGRRCPFQFVHQRRIRAVASPATLFPEPGLLTRSFDGRTDFVDRFSLSRQ